MTEEPEAVTRLRVFARNEMALESRLIEAQDAQAIVDYVDRLQRERDEAEREAADRGSYIEHLNEFNRDGDG